MLGTTTELLNAVSSSRVVVTVNQNVKLYAIGTETRE